MRRERVPVRSGTTAAPPASAWTWTFALLGGLGAWFARLLANSGLMGFACEAGALGVATLYGVTLGGVAVTVAALVTALRIRRAVAGADGDEPEALGFLAVVGVMMNLVALAGVVLETAAIPFVDVCRSL